MSIRYVNLYAFQGEPYTDLNSTIRRAVPSFREYSKRFLFPYNALQSEIYYGKDRDEFVGKSLFELAHQGGRVLSMQSGNSGVYRNNGSGSSETGFMDDQDQATARTRNSLPNPMSLHSSQNTTPNRHRRRRSSMLQSLGMSSFRSMSISSTKNQKERQLSLSRTPSKILPRSVPRLTKRELLGNVTNTTELQERFPTALLLSSGNNEFDSLLDIELQSPPHLEVDEVQELQGSFVESFPFELWEGKVTAAALRGIRKNLSKRILGSFIKSFADFCYWAFLREFASVKISLEKRDQMFLDVFEHMLDIMLSKSKYVQQIFELPVTLLCVRVVNESIFRICYPQWWSTRYGDLLAVRMDKLVSFLFDPQGYFSQLGPMISHAKERAMLRRLGPSIGTTKRSNSQVVSHLLRKVVTNPTSLGARMFLQDSNNGDQESEEYEEIRTLLGQHTASQLLSVMIKKKAAHRLTIS